MKSVGTIVIGLLLCVAACTLMFKRNVYAVYRVSDDLAYPDAYKEHSIIFVAALVGLIGAGITIVGVHRSMRE